MKRHEDDQLLREILAPEESMDFREASLERALVEVRLRRRRRALRVTLLASLPTLIILALLLLPLPGASRRNLVSSNAPAAVSFRNDPSGEIAYISNKGLFRLFPARPMALIGKPGQQKLVFLRQRRATSVP